MQVLKDRIAWLESTNEELSQELSQFRNGDGHVKQREARTKVSIDLNMQCQTHHVYIEAQNKCVKCKTNSNP